MPAGIEGTGIEEKKQTNMKNNGRQFLGIKGTARKFLGSWELELKPYLGTNVLLMGNKGLN